jgi:hypothetical protein
MKYVVNIQNAPTSTMIFEDKKHAELYYQASIAGNEVMGDHETNVLLKEVDDQNNATIINQRIKPTIHKEWQDTFM